MIYRTGDIVRTATSRQARASPRCPRDLRADVDVRRPVLPLRDGARRGRHAAAHAADRRTGAVATPPAAEQIELYYAFPLDQEEESLSLIRSTVIISGIALTLFVVGIGVLVTRLVVDPVRRAAGIAQRLAEGQLEERMIVRGEDDLARLATSFNAMADSLQRQITQLEGLSQLQQRFTSDVSHELRTPLTTVQMAAEVLHEARGRLPAARGPVGRAAAGRAGPVRGSAHRPARDQPVRRRRRGPRPGAVRSGRPGGPGGRGHVRPGRAARVPAGGQPPRRRRDRRGRRPAGGADPAQPGRQRDRARRGAAGGDHARGEPQRRGRDRPRPRCGPRARPRRSTSSTGSGAPTPPGCAPSVAAAWACRSAWRTRGCTAAGCRSGGSPGPARSSGSPSRWIAGGDLTSSPLPLRPVVLRPRGDRTMSRRPALRLLAAGAACWRS